MLDSKIAAIREALGVHSLDDWSRVAPAQVLLLDGVGPATLNYLRLILANKGRTLQDDMTPEYWAEHADRSRVSTTISNDDTHDVCPFTIVVDSREQHPYQFSTFYSDASASPDGKKRPLIVPVEVSGLESGDYSVRGFENLVAIERKSLPDLYSTLGQGRERFERELERLSKMRFAAVVIEASWSRALSRECPECGGAGFLLKGDAVVSLEVTREHVAAFGTLHLWQLVRERVRAGEIDRKSLVKCKDCDGKGQFHPLDRSRLSPLSVSRSIIAWEQRFPVVHWIDAPTRTWAEARVFRMLERFWKDVHEPEVRRTAKAVG